MTNDSPKKKNTKKGHNESAKGKDSKDKKVLDKEALDKEALDKEALDKEALDEEVVHEEEAHEEEVQEEEVQEEEVDEEEVDEEEVDESVRQAQYDIAMLCYDPKYNNPDKLLASLKITDDGRPYSNMVVEKYEPDIKLNEKMQKRPYLCMRFWPKDNKAEDVLNLAIVAFEETAGPEIEEEHVSYINAIYNRYFVGETKLRVHFTVIFGPNVEPF